MTDKAPMVSVVVPAFNAQDYLNDCLTSIHEQMGPFELETIVVDDGSIDATTAVALRHPGVMCLHQPNRGPAAARNAGIAAARGEFVAFLDADDLWPPGKLVAALDVLQQHGDAAMVFGDCRQFDAAGARERTEFEANGLGAAAWGTGGLVPDAYARLLADNFITTGAVVLRRAPLVALGGFAEDLRLVEDLDLWLRIARCHPIAWCGVVCLLRRRHALNTSRDPEAMSLAFLEVLRRQEHAGPTERAGVAAAIRRLAAGEYLRLASAALAQGRLGLALRHGWYSLRPMAGLAVRPPSQDAAAGHR